MSEQQVYVPYKEARPNNSCAKINSSADGSSSACVVEESSIAGNRVPSRSWHHCSIFVCKVSICMLKVYSLRCFRISQKPSHTLLMYLKLETLKDGTIANNFVRKSESQINLFNEKPRRHWNLHFTKAFLVTTSFNLNQIKNITNSEQFSIAITQYDIQKKKDPLAEFDLQLCPPVSLALDQCMLFELLGYSKTL